MKIVKKMLLIIPGLLLLFGAGFSLWYHTQNNQNSKNQNWETKTDPTSLIIFKYPQTISTNYISVIDWPPQIQIINDKFECTEAGVETQRAGATEKQTINNNEYCITKITEGAAGNIYTQYAYAFQKSDKTAILTFSLRFVQCDNYEDPQKTECKNERDTFNIDDLIDQIAKTLEIK